MHATRSMCTSMWVNSNGQPEKKLGLLVTRFFSREGNLNITTTALRSMVEMATHDACRSGHITPAHQLSHQQRQWTLLRCNEELLSPAGCA